MSNVAADIELEDGNVALKPCASLSRLSYCWLASQLVVSPEQLLACKPAGRLTCTRSLPRCPLSLSTSCLAWERLLRLGLPIPTKTAKADPLRGAAELMPAGAHCVLCGWPS